MGDFLAREDRVKIWSALSDIFVDNEVDYKSIAKVLKPYKKSSVEKIFFTEVAPVCYSNMRTPVPPIWTAFDTAWLESEIDKMLKAREVSAMRRLKNKMFIAYLRWSLASEWKKVEVALG
ncbi:hypothetical protein SAMN05216603_1412 [Pseudomonas benzenivorans]|nr:hypothetical protein [Pseudomonas benzenivorans]SDI31811.1 hypothetical protein SAMN05216603_1412 [Pseudomonas benzenivorans]